MSTYFFIKPPLEIYWSLMYNPFAKLFVRFFISAPLPKFNLDNIHQHIGSSPFVNISKFCSEQQTTPEQLFPEEGVNMIWDRTPDGMDGNWKLEQGKVYNVRMG